MTAEVSSAEDLEVALAVAVIAEEIPVGQAQDHLIAVAAVEVTSRISALRWVFDFMLDYSN